MLHSLYDLAVTSVTPPLGGPPTPSFQRGHRALGAQLTGGAHPFPNLPPGEPRPRAARRPRRLRSRLARMRPAEGPRRAAGAATAVASGPSGTGTRRRAGRRRWRATARRGALPAAARRGRVGTASSPPLSLSPLLPLHPGVGASPVDLAAVPSALLSLLPQRGRLPLSGAPPSTVAACGGLLGSGRGGPSRRRRGGLRGGGRAARLCSSGLLPPAAEPRAGRRSPPRLPRPGASSFFGVRGGHGGAEPRLPDSGGGGGARGGGGDPSSGAGACEPSESELAGAGVRHGAGAPQAGGWGRGGPHPPGAADGQGLHRDVGDVEWTAGGALR